MRERNPKSSRFSLLSLLVGKIFNKCVHDLLDNSGLVVGSSTKFASIWDLLGLQ